MAGLYRPRKPVLDENGDHVLDSKGRTKYRHTKVWWISYRVNGRLYRESTRTTSKALAKKIANERQARIDRGTHEFTVGTSKDLGEFLPELEAKLRLTCRPKSVLRYMGVARRFFGFLVEERRSTELRKISPKDLEDYLQSRLGSIKRSTLRSELKSLSRVFSVAQKYRYVPSNPCKEVDSIKAPEPDMRFFTQAHVRTLLKHAGGFELPIKFLVLTGVRAGEFANLHWEDLDLTRGRLIVRNRDGFTTKSQRIRHIPLNEELLEGLKAWRLTLPSHRRKGLVFRTDLGTPWKLSSLYKRFERVLFRAGLKERHPKDRAQKERGWNVHSCRHTFISWLVMAGVDLVTVQRLAGHADIKTTMRYAHLAPGHLNDSVDRLSIDKRVLAHGSSTLRPR